MTAGALDLLALAREGDEAAAARVLEENSGLIWAVVRRYYGKGVEPDDLYQLGCLGFLKAVRGFDVSYGTQFSTYAVPKIAGEIRRHLRDNGLIKVGRTLKEQGISIYAARERLRVRLGREPVLSELSAETGLTPEEIAVAELAAAPPDTASSPVSNTPFRMSPTVNVRKNTKHIISRNTGIPHTGWVRSRSILSVEAAFLLLLKRVSFITFSI